MPKPLWVVKPPLPAHFSHWTKVDKNGVDPEENMNRDAEQGAGGVPIPDAVPAPTKDVTPQNRGHCVELHRAG